MTGTTLTRRTAITLALAAFLARATPGHWNAGAQWYLALTYVKTNQRPKARQLARQVADLKGHPYQQEARQLLRQLTSTKSNPR